MNKTTSRCRSGRKMEVIQLEMGPFQGHGVRLCSDIFERVH